MFKDVVEGFKFGFIRGYVNRRMKDVCEQAGSHMLFVEDRITHPSLYSTTDGYVVFDVVRIMEYKEKLSMGLRAYLDLLTNETAVLIFNKGRFVVDATYEEVV
jgi:hypothetical protein